MSSREPLFGTRCHVLLTDPSWQPLSCPPGGLLFALTIMSSWLPTHVNNYHVLVLNPTWYLPSCPLAIPFHILGTHHHVLKAPPSCYPQLCCLPLPPRSPQSFPLMPDFFIPVSMSFWWRSLRFQYHVLWRSTSCPPFALTLGTSHQALLICINTTTKNSVDKDC